MSLPFSAAEFLAVFARYNQAVWPAQALFYAAAAAVVWLALRPAPRAGRAIGIVLALLWAWMGAVYHWTFFRPINPAAAIFGAMFVLQAALFVLAAAVRPRLTFRVRRDAPGIAGAVLAGYALAGYPLLGLALGQRWPAMPTFGLPCPTTIFTFGVLLWAGRSAPAWLLPIPAAWAVVGTSAAASLGIAEDYGLLPAAVAAIAILLWERRGRGIELAASHPSTP